MTETEANTIALHINTLWIIIGTIATIIVSLWGYKKYKTKNLIKRTINKNGEIAQGEGKNIIEDVDNTDGIIRQN